jgi:WD40 repeat protein
MFQACRKGANRRVLLLAALATLCLGTVRGGEARRPELLLPLGHSNQVQSVALSSDGKRVLTGSMDQTAILWDVASGKPVQTFKGHGGTVGSVALSGDGQRVLTGAWDKTANVWDIATGKPLRTFRGHTREVRGVALSRDGKHALTGGWDSTAILWQVDTGQIVQTFRGKEGLIYAVALSGDGKRILTAGSGRPVLWDVATGQPLQSFQGHTNYVPAAALDETGSRILTGSADKTAILWDGATGQALQTFRGHTASVFGAALSSDGKRALTGADLFDNSAILWDTATGKTLQTFKGTSLSVNAVALSSDGQRVLTASLWKAMLWDVRTAQPVQTFQVYAELAGPVALSGDGKHVLTSRYTAERGRLREVVLWDLATAQQQRRIGGPLLDRSVPLNTAGKRLVTGPTLWDAETGKYLRNFVGHDKYPWCVAISGDGKRVLTGAPDHKAILWDAGTGQALHTFQGKEGDFSAVALSRDGKRVLTAQFPDNVLWDADTGKAIHALKGRSNVLALSADGRRALTVGNTATLWDTQTAQAIRSFDPLRYPEPYRHLEHKNTYVHALALSGDGKRALMAASGPIAILWDAEQGTPLQILHGHQASVLGVAAAFGPADALLVTSCADGVVRLWKAGREEPVFSFLAVGEEWLFFTPEGYYTCSPNGENLIAWKVAEEAPPGYRVVGPEQFRKQFYRPDLFRHLLDELDLTRALARADKESNRPAVAPTTIARALPPVVLITRPDRDGAIDSEALTVEAVAVSVGEHPVVRLRLLVDGRPYQGNLSDYKVSMPQLGRARRSWQVELEPGEHTVQVVADNTAGSEGRSDIVRVQRKTIVETLPRLFVLAVGISDYNKEALRKGVYYAAADARKFADTIERSSKPLYREIQVARLLDQDASRAKILRALAQLKKPATTRDAVLIFFAGHGKRDEQNNFYFLPAEADLDDLAVTGLSEGDFKAAVKGLPGRVILLLDACHSGALIENERRSGEGLTDRLYRDLTSNEYGLILMCSSRGLEVSQESSAHKSGFFALALVEGLQGKARKLDGAVYLRALDDYVNERVRELTEGRQHPLTSRPPTIRDIALTRP